MGEAALIALRQPDKIYLTYGKDIIELDIKADFTKYIFTVRAEDVGKYKKYMTGGK